MPTLRRAAAPDLDFLIRLDLDGEGYTDTDEDESFDADTHRRKIAGFVHDADKAAWVIEAAGKDNPVGGILCRFRDLDAEAGRTDDADFYESIRSFLPEDGRFCEVFNLWIAPDFRRQGLAVRLKRQLERESRHRGFTMIYTHTEKTNPRVIALNLKLGYRQIRSGPIWDEIERVSLVKDIG